MATETESGPAVDSSYRRSLVTTTVSTLSGVAAGVTSAFVASGPSDLLGLGAYAAFALGQLGVMRAFGIDVQGFSKKDTLYVLFMAFALWFITWGILLTSNTV